MEERLKRFSKLIDHGSFSTAAKSIHISQPALSMAIAKLEKDLGTELYEKGSRPIKMTLAGRAAYQSAKNLETEAKNLRQKINEVKKARGKIVLGLIDSVASKLFENDELIERLDAVADTTVIVDNSRNLLKMVKDHGVDVALLTCSEPSEDGGLEFKEVGSEKMVLVCHPDLKKTAEKSLRLGLISNFIGYDKKSKTFKYIEAELVKSGVKTRPKFSATSPEVMLQMAMLGRGTACLPLNKVKPMIKAGKINIVKSGLDLRRKIYLVKLADRKLPEVLQTLEDGRIYDK